MNSSINLPNEAAFIYGNVSGALEKGGVGALELVAMDMKARYHFFSQILVAIYMKSQLVSIVLSVTGTMSQSCFLYK